MTIDIFIVNGISIDSSRTTYSPFVGIYMSANKNEAIGMQMEHLKKLNLGAAAIDATLATQTCREFVKKLDQIKENIDGNDQRNID